MLAAASATWIYIPPFIYIVNRQETNEQVAVISSVTTWTISLLGWHCSGGTR